MEENYIQAAIYLGMLVLHIIEMIFINKGKTEKAEKIAKKKEKLLNKLKSKEKKLEENYKTIQEEIKKVS